MATALGRDDATAVTDPELWREQQRFYNFLQRYDLLKYHQRFLKMGVRRLTHFKDVTDPDLDAVGLTPPEKTRLRKKWDEHFSTKGKIIKAIAGKGKVFDGDPGSEMAPPLRSPLEPTSHEATLISKEDIKMTKKLGEGAHGTVFEGTWSNKHGSVVVAVKTLYGKEEVHSTFIKEAQSMRSLLHQHIIQLYGIVLSSPLMLIQELAPLGDMNSFLQKHGASRNLALFHTYAVQIADAMRYLEGKKIVHRDLATRNILLATEDFVKLSDFGMARILDEQTGIYNLSNLQSRIPISWTALEALTQAKFSTASDIWSYAVTLWEIYSLGEIPWKGLNPIEIRNCLVRGERLGCPERCPSEIYHVMLASWEARPQDRPTFAGIHETLQQRCQPTQARAIKVHTVAEGEDNNCLSFKKGDVIYIINKPKNGWLYGMTTDGRIGYFLEDHVTTILDPIGDIKEKLQAGKYKVAELPISAPTQVSHELHWGKNGEKWGKTEEELMSNDPARNRSPMHSPPFRVITSPDHTPTSKHRPRDNTMATDLPTCYATHSPTLIPEGPAAATSRQNSNDQYVTMKRGATMAVAEEDLEDYIDMQPNHRYRRAEVAHSMYENVGLNTAEEDFYIVPRSRTMIPSDSSSGGGDSRPGSANKKELPPRGERDTPSPRLNSSQRSMTLPAFSTRLPSQYSVAETVSSQISQEFMTSTPTGAISPTNVKYFPMATSSTVGEDKKTTSCEDVRRTENGSGPSEPQASNQSPVKPKPKPRAGLSPVKRSSSTITSANITANGGRKFSLPEEAPNSRDMDRLSNSTAHNDKQPLIPIKAPQVPDRTYMASNSPTRHQGNGNTLDYTHNTISFSPSTFDNPLADEFPDEPEMCRRALEIHRSDIDKAREEIQVQILLGMRIPHTKSEDCRRALKHCQGKIDRAASWLVEQNLELLESA